MLYPYRVVLPACTSAASARDGEPTLEGADPKVLALSEHVHTEGRECFCKTVGARVSARGIETDAGVLALSAVEKVLYHPHPTPHPHNQPTCSHPTPPQPRPVPSHPTPPHPDPRHAIPSHPNTTHPFPSHPNPRRVKDSYGSCTTRSRWELTSSSQTVTRVSALSSGQLCPSFSAASQAAKWAAARQAAAC